MHIKNSLAFRITFILCFTQLLLACEADTTNRDVSTKSTTSKQKHTPWVMSQQTDKQAFSVKFSCQQKPYVGDFQQCRVLLLRADTKVADAVISIDGGMKAHGHGLPTSPKISATANAGEYKVEGLKFSMSGDWMVGFRISSKQSVDKELEETTDKAVEQMTDQTVFRFSI